MYTRKLYLIRHGATYGNLQGRYVGCTDEELLEESIVSLSKRPKLTGHVYTSPMRRCIQTADCLCASRSYTVIDSWRERDFGAFEYKNYQELSGDSRYQKWIDSNGVLPFPEGEDEAAFQKRCIDGFMEMLCHEERYQSRGEKQNSLKDSADAGTVVCILHGGVIMTLLSKLTDSGKSFYDYQCKNGEGYLLTCQWEEVHTPQLTDIVKIEMEDKSDEPL